MKTPDKLLEFKDLKTDYKKGTYYYDRKNYKEALVWYKKAAKQGNVFAQSNLGYMYYNGDGVSQDYKEALIWYKKAAKQGDATAQFNLGLMYYEGEGISQDLTQAYSWLYLAYIHGFKKSAETLKTLAKKMSSKQIAKAKKNSSQLVQKINSNK